MLKVIYRFFFNASTKERTFIKAELFDKKNIEEISQVVLRGHPFDHVQSQGIGEGAIKFD